MAFCKLKPASKNLQRPSENRTCSQAARIFHARSQASPIGSTGVFMPRPIMPLPSRPPFALQLINSQLEIFSTGVSPRIANGPRIPPEATPRLALPLVGARVPTEQRNKVERPTPKALDAAFTRQLKPKHPIRGPFAIRPP